MKKLYMTGNTHFDPVWLWKWDEACASIRATFRSALDRMKEDESFIYSFATPPVFEWIKNIDPELFLNIQKRVDEGRWDICEGWWVQPDCYSATGESYVRQGLYGQKYLKENFGKISDTVFNIDSFGHSPALPQILNKSHIKYYCFVRPEKHHFPLTSQLFRWKGIDGSEVLAYRAEQAYAKTIAAAVSAQTDKDLDNLIVYGVTDHGGAPTKKLIAEINETENAHFSTVSDFFKDHESCDYTVSDEILTGDFGPYSNHPYIKKLNRIAEYSVLNAEKASVIAKRSQKETLEKCWHDILFNQFHDILGGASIKEAYFDAENSLGRAISTACEIKHFALQSITKDIKTIGKNPDDIWNLVIWNLNSDEFSGHIEAEVQWVHEFPWYDKGIALRDEDGNVIPCQVIQAKSVIPSFRSRFVFKAKIPPLGYKSFVVVKTEEDVKNNEINPFLIETDNLKIEISEKSGCISRVFDKCKNELLAENLMHPKCRFDDGDTWCFNISGYDEKVENFDFLRAKVIEAGDVRTVIKYEYKFKNSLLFMYYTFYKNEEYFDISYKVNWNEKHYVLKLESEISENEHIASVPYGYIKRCENRRDMPMGAVLKTSDFNVVCDSIFSYNMIDKTLGLTVLRSAIYGDLRLGELDYDLDFDHLSQGITEGKVRVDFGRNSSEDGFLNPPTVIVEANHDGTLSTENRYFCVNSDTVKISTIKHSEFDDSIILRLFESSGVSQSVKLTIGKKEYELNLKGFEIKTLKLESDMIFEIPMTEF